MSRNWIDFGFGELWDRNRDRININIGNENYPNQYRNPGIIGDRAYFPISLSSYIDLYKTSRDVRFGNGSLEFRFQNIGKTLPERAYLKSIKIAFYIEKYSSHFDLTRIHLRLKKDPSKFYGFVELSNKERRNVGAHEITFLDIQYSEPITITNSLLENSEINFYIDKTGMSSYEDWQNYWYPYRGADYQFNVSQIISMVPMMNIGPRAPKLFLEIGFLPAKPPTSLTPSNVTINPAGPIQFKWNTPSSQEKYELRYKIGNGAWNNISGTTSLNYHVLPAGTITSPTGNVIWQVRYLPSVPSEYASSNESNWTEWVESGFELGIPEQAPARIIGPNGDYFIGDGDINFEWAFIPNSTEEQSNYELEYWIGDVKYSLSGTTETKSKITLKNVVTSIGKWRVRVKNNYGQWSPWSEEGLFQIVARPKAPIIGSVTSDNFPLISWQAKEQEFYSIKILDRQDNTIYELEEIVSRSDFSYRITEPLHAGRYTVKMYIGNVFGMRSDEVEYSFDVLDPVSIIKPEIRLFESDFYISVSSDKETGDVIRNGIKIGELINGEFKDCTGANNKEYEYIIRYINDFKMKESDSKTGRASFSGNTISLINTPLDYFNLKWNIGGKPSKEKTFDSHDAEFVVDGNKYPTYEYGILEKEILHLSFTIRDFEENRLREILKSKSNVLYRDYTGFNIVGNIGSFEIAKVENYRQVTFTIQKTSDKYD